jgi:hypothetical protein
LIALLSATAKGIWGFPALEQTAHTPLKERRTDLFTLVQRANPALQRRQAEQVYQKTIQLTG